MYIAANFDPSTSTIPMFNTIAYDGCKVLIINESIYNIMLNFPNGATSYVPANDRRFFDFSGSNAQPTGIVSWSINTTTNQLNSFNKVVVEVYQPDETTPEVYPSPLFRSLIGVV